MKLANKYKSLPLYRSCAIILRQQILDGVWEEGEKLPSENELVQQFGASRITIRQALQLLETEGLITRIQGKGTFIAKKRVEQDLSGIHNYAQQLKQEGTSPGFIIESNSIIQGNKHICKNLNLDMSEKVYRIKRIKLQDNAPLMYERLFLPCKFAPDLTINMLSEVWLSTILKEKYGLPITRVKQTIEPIIIGDEEAEKLQVPPQSLGLIVDRLSWSGDQVILFTRSIVRGDQAKYYIEIDGRSKNVLGGEHVLS